LRAEACLLQAGICFSFFEYSSARTSTLPDGF
jgi:hypothetical protein